MTDDTPIDYDSILPRPEGEESFERKAERLIDASLKRLKDGTVPKQPCALCDTCSERLADLRGIIALAACLAIDPNTVKPEFRDRVRYAIASHALREVKRNEAKEAEAEKGP